MSSTPPAKGDTPDPRQQRLVWIDLEMTGLDPDSDVIIEIATLVTDKYLHELAVGPVFAVRQPHKYLEAMDEWNTTHHTRSGLPRLIGGVIPLTVVFLQEPRPRVMIESEFHPPLFFSICGSCVGLHIPQPRFRILAIFFLVFWSLAPSFVLKN